MIESSLQLKLLREIEKRDLRLAEKTSWIEEMWYMFHNIEKEENLSKWEIYLEIL